uniref:K Homology domain-containing protein n=1 Tax=Chromera velia CCMP2878 TaxID=1169474 RepID=A0A0G4FPY0_9ALVE|mmetsp:Transcript_5793/g.11492  ORF Transcript_5793/g.11492 Transcript_5793/m.11492 type:complete len:287 (+) Transcript_5793:39-899(+)|eukprot:Cvel_18179.t1-p1 / transcript=Cvel_18179.t1 / gene=Cvel_18179 / organism=Chromera_velia_CCMP2878 / gene_product=RNA-binding protein PNO1, putative / transcript_product=RNA-binding protein PNO1, putative / location=Cvel_scaffold1491:23946-24803(-) / protein_length=286 / sequence_SO=supercontig / SO=protein_coding / is_pseudo=false
MQDTGGDSGFQPVRGKRVARGAGGPVPYKLKGKDEDSLMGDCEEAMEGNDEIAFETVALEKDEEIEIEASQDQKEGEEDGGEGEVSFPAVMIQEHLKARGFSKDYKLRMRRIAVPSHRYTPLKKHWLEILQPLVEHMKLQVRMNTKRRGVEIRTSPETKDISALQKAADFVRAFMLGFEVQDAIALLRLDDLFVESFEVKDVKRLQGDHLSRCIGRISGKDGKTKYAIENSTRTRIVVADSRIHILGSFQNIRFARNAVCSLILGSPPGKVYNHLRAISKRMTERM